VPGDVTPARLFRLLLGRPRPVLPLAFRLPDAPDVALSVRGLTALEDASVGDVDEAPEEVRRSEITRRLVAAYLLADGVPAFTADDVGTLEEHEFTRLAVAVFAAARIVSPQYRNVTQATLDAIEAGAKDRGNRALTRLVGSGAPVVLPRRLAYLADPARYFGLALADMTDGQLMAYHAAKKVTDTE
jgi:hypothetical protein